MPYAMKPLGCDPCRMAHGAEAATCVETFLAAIRRANVDRPIAAVAPTTE